MKAFLVGNFINNGDIITMSQVGNHILKVEVKDKAGNPRIQEIQFRVIYNFGGYLPPIKVDGSGIYQLGRTLPVKFQLFDVNNDIVSFAQARLFFAASGTNSFISAVSSGGANTDNEFRFDTADKQYIFNWSTKILNAGIYRLRADLNDGTSKFADVRLDGGQLATLSSLLDKLYNLLTSLLEIIKRLP